VDYLRFSLVAFNAVLFLVLTGWSLRLWRREPSPRTRLLWLTVGLVSGALVFGAIQRLALQAALLGWVDVSATDSVLMDWQLVQSLVVGVLAITAFLSVRRVAAAMVASERVAGSILDRVSHVDPSSLELSKRENEVLAMIGRGRISDAELSVALHISASTVQTHVKSLLRKTGLKSRQDLVAVAVMVDRSR
jgi:DNA-binding CsgD family transcriptional regulator